jgi:tRNA modification GTPase
MNSLEKIKELNRTIVSLVTSPITQNIAIIRISGSKTYKILRKIYGNQGKKMEINNLIKIRKRIIFGKIIDEKKEAVDEVLFFCFYKPNSFTGEDVVEISCHGNIFITKKIIQLIIKNGGELANRGEFTKQAFFNSKINLIQANAINDIIKSQSLTGTKIALHNLDSKKQEELFLMEESLLDMIANIKVNIDYPEYDGVKYLEGREVKENLLSILKKLYLIKEMGDKTSFYQEGLKIAIIGRPNVGKSTLLNSILKEDKSIVSHIKGTTRDVIEARYILNDVPLILIDTAGIHETKDFIEKIGIKKSLKVIEKADAIFFLLDATQK